MTLFNDVKRTLPERQFSAERRYDDGAEHHTKAVKLMEFLMDYDYQEMGDSLGWEVGGDGDNGESLLYALSVYFEYLDYGKE
jgi:hypothetical protein